MKCIECKKEYAEGSYFHQTLDVCSFDCLKTYKEKKNIKFKPFQMRMNPQKGRGKNHIHWITTKDPCRKDKPIPD